ncbi:hypothetical protein Cgig2_025585 [Carnegiea gigantea]|uniref:Uncharacterized protein n=1 Tax=Carnegiea gigantea TaxID=171969 RepID=A0A9Q1GKI9_9CARY|nr:hypothetical protein Cgig2_025585 [Carnegiea gigantea]
MTDDYSLSRREMEMILCIRALASSSASPYPLGGGALLGNQGVHSHLRDLVVTGGREIEDTVRFRVEYEDHIDSSDNGIEEEASDRAESFVACDDMRPSVREAMNVKNFEIQEGDDEEIPLVRDNMELDIVDAEIVDANLMDANFIQDNNDENDEDVVSKGDEDEFPDRESDIDSFDRDLEEDESDDARKRGPTRGLKSLREREQNPNVKPFVKITPNMEHLFGKHANRFIVECSKRVKEFCSLDSTIDEDAKIRLFDKIKVEWNLPIEADGINVGHALELQCMLLYRGWSYQLKEEHFSKNTITQAFSNKPPEVHKDKWDWLIIPSLMHPQDSCQDPNHDGAQDPTQQIEEVPAYVQLWERTKRHKDGSWDPEAVAKYEEFKELHMSQMKKEGADNLSLKEAYLLVIKEKSGYHRGLGPGPQLPRKGRGQCTEVRVEITAEIQQLQQKEAALQGQVGELQIANSELKAEIEQMKSEAIERDNKLKQELIERERKHKKEAIEREKKIRAEVMEMLRNLNRGI